MSEWEPVEEYGSVREEFVVDHNRIWVGAVEEDEWIVLPADLRLCRRVEPEAITAEALAQEGFRQAIGGSVSFRNSAGQREAIGSSAWNLYLEDIASVVSVYVADGKPPEVFLEERGHSTMLPGVKDMPQLRALVEFLQG